MNIFIINLKRILKPLLCILFIICLLFFSTSNIQAAKNGFLIWQNSLLPCLFPFFVSVELLKQTEFPAFCSKHLSKFSKKIFNLPGCAILPIIMGTISGYPTSAIIISDLRKNNQLTQNEGNRLLAFTNNSSPIYIIGTIGIILFHNISLGIILFFIQLISSISTGIILKYFPSKNSNSNLNQNATSNYTPFTHNFIIQFINSIKNSLITIFYILGFIIFFAVLISVINELQFIKYFSQVFSKLLFISPNIIENFLLGLIEITNGINSFSIIGQKNISTIFIAICALINFSGISVGLQIYSIIYKTDLSIKKYFFGKLIQTIFSVVYSAIFIHFFNMNL